MEQGAPTPEAPLAAWLEWLESGARGQVLLGLERVRAVAERMELPSVPTLSIAGTNGKGSCAHFAHRLASACGLRTALYTSPHLCDFTERIVVGDMAVDADTVRDALAMVERRRGDVPLTYFEHTTLAAFHCFAQAGVDLQVLEVGLGGRLDAVNVLDADVAVVTSIGRDHIAELGSRLPDIAREKAGIARPGRPAIIGTPAPPAWLRSALERTGARTIAIPASELEGDAGNWRMPGIADALPPPTATGRAVRHNITAATMALQALEHPQLSAARLRAALPAVVGSFHLPGRQQRHDGLLLDIAHNIEAMTEVVSVLPSHGGADGWHVVLGMLRDKPVDGILAVLLPHTAALYCAAPRNPRALAAEALCERALAKGLPVYGVFGTVSDAVAAARQQAPRPPRILVTGSLFTVSEVLCA